ncbi:MAG: hypothetical protein U0163_12000 [Gemmatimonadaceae bacterium]
MISYEVPSRRSRDIQRQPLLYAAIAAQKNNYAIYLMSVYGSEALGEAAQGRPGGNRQKKPDMESPASDSRSSKTFRSLRSPTS